MLSSSPRMQPIYVGLLLLCLAQGSLAARKYVNWFADSKGIFQPISAGTCNATLKAYNDEYDALGGAWWIDLGLRKYSPIYGLCRDQMTCIINNLDEASKASLASGQVVLGLLPTLLAVISPSIAELALLSVHRPLLGGLISIGSPVTRLALALGPWSKTTSTVVSVIQYLLVLGSGANVLWLAAELGVRSILSWGCTRSWPVMLWAAFPLVIHLFSTVGYRLTLDPTTRHVRPPVVLHKQDSFFTPPPPSRIASSLKDPPQADKSGPFTSITSTITNEIPLLPIQNPSTDVQVVENTPASSRLWTVIKREFIPCAAHPDTVINNRLPLEHPNTRVKVGIALNCFAGFLSCMHLLYGTVVFASFNFIYVLDVISNISLRFLVSSIVCRLVILLEIAGMRGARMAAMAQRGQEKDDSVVKFTNGPNGDEAGKLIGSRKPYRRQMRL
ncbi:uncharacterized protein AB675_1565 [Cyphellophora attinorum]|uniref:Uncharacterized protein n=1 Tax=Cyphellophora attinorum TaxID=1664694 RepID=A0A0N0NJY5_9EURO|nr:uncharacterized protein AB675_1565 [Phialophora attinorum]KPI37189.1 hypothetical protein AB675_1565 [Phialophora attinorum]